VPEEIIDGLEAINVDVHHRICPTSLAPMLQFLHQEPSVAQFGQIVVKCLMLQSPANNTQPADVMGGDDVSGHDGIVMKIDNGQFMRDRFITPRRKQTDLDDLAVNHTIGMPCGKFTKNLTDGAAILGGDDVGQRTALDHLRIVTQSTSESWRVRADETIDSDQQGDHIRVVDESPQTLILMPGNVPSATFREIAHGSNRRAVGSDVRSPAADDLDEPPTFSCSQSNLQWRPDALVPHSAECMRDQGQILWVNQVKDTARLLLRTTHSKEILGS
jgi:hypothetical protein